MKTKLIISLIIVLVISGSCSEDFLTVPPKHELTEGLFFTEEADFQQAVNGIHEPLREHADGWWTTNEFRSDNTMFFYFRPSRFLFGQEAIHEFIDTYGATGKYNSMYQVINRANTVLARIDGLEFDQTRKDALIGEAYFLRSFAYFELVKFFGDVILYLEPVTNYESSFQARTPMADVYDQIIADAQLAAGLLPGKPSQYPGRPTSGSARTLLGDVYMTLSRWSEAETVLKEVESSNHYALLSDYADCFKPSNKNHLESVFCIQFLDDPVQDMGNRFPYEFIPKVPDPSVITGVSPAIMNERGGYNLPTPELLAAYEEGDLRKDASIAYYTGPSPEEDINYVDFPYTHKFLHPHSQFGHTDVNWPVYRYAEVLLFLAEAINEQGNNPSEALGYLNQIRNRAGLDGVTETGQAALREIIIDERRVEFAFENKRWTDLLRWGIAREVMNEFGEKVHANPYDYGYLPGFEPEPHAFNVTEHRLLFAIPSAEMERNPLMVQNPGY